MKLTAEEEREIENIRDLMESETTYVPIVYKDWLDFLLRNQIYFRPPVPPSGSIP